MREITTRFEQPIDLYALTDVHVGNINFTREMFEKTIMAITDDDNAYYVLLGDLADAVTVRDRRYRHVEIDREFPHPNAQYEYLKTVLPKDKCLGVWSGNHDEKLKGLQTGEDFAKSVADAINAPYMGYMNYLTLRFNDQFGKRKYRIFGWHGHGKGKMVGGRINNLVKMAAFEIADVYLCGHFHMYNHFIGGRRRETMGKGRIERIDFIHCGGFYKGWVTQSPTGYEAQWGLMPSFIGCPKLSFKEELVVTPITEIELNAQKEETG